MMWGYGAGWGWMTVMMVMWLVLIGLIVWAVLRAVPGGQNRPAAPPPPTPPSSTPREILDRRLATGEIDVATYRTLLAELGDGRAEHRS